MDVTAIRPPGAPNYCLALPPGIGAVKPQVESPVFAADPDRVASAWRSVVERAPRAEIVDVSDDGLSIEAVQRSSLIGFIDRISARAVPMPGDRASLAVYSRSAVGYWDLGVNRRRVLEWLGTLGRVLRENRVNGSLS